MPAPGRVIENPISGERIVIRRTGEDTGGALLAFELYLPPGGHVPAGHVHPEQQERFTIVEGAMEFRLGRRRLVAKPGDTVQIEPGRAHWFGNCGSGEAHAYVEVRPALRMQEMFEATEQVSTSGRFLGTRLPRPTDLAMVLLEFERELAVPVVPRRVARMMLAPLAFLGRRRRPSSQSGKPV